MCVMSDLESIVREVDGSVAMESMPLHAEGKVKIRSCLSDMRFLEKVADFSSKNALCLPGKRVELKKGRKTAQYSRECKV